jgi:hypothetical protein
MREQAVTIRHPKTLPPAAEGALLEPAVQLLKSDSELFVRKNLSLVFSQHIALYFVGGCNVAHTITFTKRQHLGQPKPSWAYRTHKNFIHWRKLPTNI